VIVYGFATRAECAREFERGVKMEITKEKMFTLKVQRVAGRLKITYWKNKEFEKIFSMADKTSGKYGDVNFQYARRSVVVEDVQRLLRGKNYVDTLEGDEYMLGYEGQINAGLLRIETGAEGLTFDAKSGGVELTEFIEKIKEAHKMVYEQIAQNVILDVEMTVKIAKE
jgi:uncharacterized protein YqgV (UPF0045/DUF77 family)